MVRVADSQASDLCSIHGQVFFVSFILLYSCNKTRIMKKLDWSCFISEQCRAMKTKGMVFRYMWVYSKEDTMAHTRRPVVTS